LPISFQQNESGDFYKKAEFFHREYKNRIHFYPLIHVENSMLKKPVISRLEMISQNCQQDLSTDF
jgi:hypothetical protein